MAASERESPVTSYSALIQFPDGLIETISLEANTYQEAIAELVVFKRREAKTLSVTAIRERGEKGDERTFHPLPRWLRSWLNGSALQLDSPR